MSQLLRPHSMPYLLQSQYSCAFWTSGVPLLKSLPLRALAEEDCVQDIVAPPAASSAISKICPHSSNRLSLTFCFTPILFCLRLHPSTQLTTLCFYPHWSCSMPIPRTSYAFPTLCLPSYHLSDHPATPPTLFYSTSHLFQLGGEKALLCT